jgi:excisionase family DNA binding protein
MERSERWLSVPEAARVLGLHPETVRRFVREKRLPATRIGRSWRFRSDRLDAWLEERPAERPGRILAVDDEAHIRELVRLTLSPLGHTVIALASGRAALSECLEILPDLVLLDLKLPDMPGAAVLQAIREHAPALPVLVMTGHTESALLSDALRFTPLTVLAKPVSPAQLVVAVRAALAGSRQTATP